MLAGRCTWGGTRRDAMDPLRAGPEGAWRMIRHGTGRVAVAHPRLPHPDVPGASGNRGSAQPRTHEPIWLPAASVETLSSGGQVRTAVHDPSAASLRRVCVGRVPRLQQYYQRTPDARPAALRFPSLGGTSGCPASLPPGQRGARTETSPPSDPCLHAPPPTPAEFSAACLPCHSVGFRDEKRGSITRPARLPVYASQTAYAHATLGSGLSTLAGQDSHLLGR